MASSLTSLSPIKLPRRCCDFCFGIRYLSLHHPPPVRRCAQPRPPRGRSTALSLSFSNGFSSQSQGGFPMWNLAEVPSLRSFIADQSVPAAETASDLEAAAEGILKGRLYHETYGCQMNINDMEIVLSIMKNAGYSDVVGVPKSAEIIFINTYAIRDNAEQKVWQRLNCFWFLKRHWKSNVTIGRSQSMHPPKVVVLGCMAERLKEKFLDADKIVDVVCGPDACRDLPRLLEEVDSDVEPSSNRKYGEGFSSMCKVGLRFYDLLDRLSTKIPEMRFRYTSPHPKDFPEELIYLMKDRHNICKYIHLPAQTGSSTVLERMRLGYTREVYLDLVHKIRSIIPEMGISSDFSCGFCGETEDEHRDTRSLVRAVGYDMACMFADSMREKIHAHRNYGDDVPEEVEQRKLNELIEAFRESTELCYDSQIGSIQLVLVEGPNKSAPDTELIGKSDRGHRVSFVNLPMVDRSDVSVGQRNPRVGDYVEVRILKSSRASLLGEVVAITKLSSFYQTQEENSVALEAVAQKAFPGNIHLYAIIPTISRTPSGTLPSSVENNAGWHGDSDRSKESRRRLKNQIPTMIQRHRKVACELFCCFPPHAIMFVRTTRLLLYRKHKTTKAIMHAPFYVHVVTFFYVIL